MPWSEPSLGLERQNSSLGWNLEPQVSPAISWCILAHCWLAHLGTSCCWFAVLQHFQFLCNCSTVCYCLMPHVPGPAAKGIRHSQEPQQPPPAGRQWELRTQWKASRTGVQPSTKSLRAVAVAPSQERALSHQHNHDITIEWWQRLHYSLFLSIDVAAKSGHQFAFTRPWSGWLYNISKLGRIKEKQGWKDPTEIIYSSPSSSRQDKLYPHHSCQTEK